MRDRLAKLASTSAKLRAGVEKKAFVFGLLGRGALAAGKAAGKFALKNKVTTGLGVLGTVGAVGTARETKAKFDPAYGKAMMGLPPVPPGADS